MSGAQNLTLTTTAGQQLVLASAGLRGLAGPQGPNGGVIPSFLQWSGAFTPPRLAPSVIINDYAPTGCNLNSLEIYQAADNEGSRLGGHLAAPVGTTIYGWNRAPNIDAAVLVFLHEWSGSVAANRHRCPNKDHLLIPQGGFYTRTYAQDPYDGAFRWLVSAGLNGGRQLRTVTHGLGIFPHLLMEPISGVVLAYDAVAHSAQSDTPYVSNLFACGVSGQLKDACAVYLQTVDGSGATLGGLLWRSTDTADEPSGQGRVHVLMNLGPGVVTLPHQYGPEAPVNRFFCAGATDLHMPLWGSVTVLETQMGGWWVIGKNF